MRPDSNGRQPAVAVEQLVKHFAITKGVLQRRQIGTVRAVDGISFAIPPAATFAIVGESGCGKTTTARLLLGLEQPTQGRIDLGHREVAGAAQPRIQAVFQDPYSSLNPRLTVRRIIAEPLRQANGLDGRTISDRIADVVRRVGLEPSAVERYPHMFSGGQRQRIAIARAIVSDPGLIVLDEPVSALDVSIRAQILNLLKDFQEQLGVAYLMITHDLATVRFIAETIAVMYRGRFVEQGPARVILSRPRHPYTRSLVAASRLAAADPGAAVAEDVYDTAVTDGSCCPFHGACPMATAVCAAEMPALRLADDRLVACHHAGHC